MQYRIFEWPFRGRMSSGALVAIGLVFWLGNGCVNPGPQRGRVLSVAGFRLYPGDMPGTAGPYAGHRFLCVGIHATGEYCLQDLDPATPADVRMRTGQTRERYGELPVVVFSDDNVRIGTLRSLLQELETGGNVCVIHLAGARGPAEDRPDFVRLAFEGRLLAADKQLPSSRIVKLTTKGVYLGDRACDSISGLRNVLPPSVDGGKDVPFAVECEDDVQVAVLAECLFLLKGEGYTELGLLAVRQGKP